VENLCRVYVQNFFRNLAVKEFLLNRSTFAKNYDQNSSALFFLRQSLAVIPVFKFTNFIYFKNLLTLYSQVNSAICPMWDDKMTTSQTAVMLCSWEGNQRPGGK